MSPIPTPSPALPDWLATFYHWLEAAPAVALAVLGGVVRVLIASRRRECPVRVLVWEMVVGIVAACFAGVLTWLFLESSPIPPGIQAGIVGMAGYSGPQLLAVFSRKLLRGAEKCDM
uniref:Holin n=1 Tax=Desulfovibrio sp. U5L TaxID=596152 RepID=I2Q038_9BACT